VDRQHSRLRNVIFEALAYKRTGTTLLLSDLPRRILRKGGGRERESAVDRSALAAKIDRGAMNLREEVAALERLAIEEAGHENTKPLQVFFVFSRFRGLSLHACCHVRSVSFSSLPVLSPI
jgi:hypothetical protein